MRILYRVRQFWQALTAVPNPEDVETARGLLTPSLMTLFLGMQPSEQASREKATQIYWRQLYSTILEKAAILYLSGSAR